MDSDTVIGLYVFCADWHPGQGSRLYRVLSRISTQYKPSLPGGSWRKINGSLPDPSGEWERAREVYQKWEQWAKTHGEI